MRFFFYSRTHDTDKVTIDPITLVCLSFRVLHRKWTGGLFA